VEARREGKQRFYLAKPEVLGPLGGALETMWKDALWRLKLAVELEESRRGPKPKRKSTRPSKIGPRGGERSRRTQPDRQGRPKTHNRKDGGR
jgi:hypothetical protein